jgi:uncharacterized membrane protein
LSNLSIARLARTGLSRALTATTVAALMLSALAPIAAADDGLEVTTPYPAVAVAPGSEVSFDLTVTSTRIANVGLALSGVPEGWSATLHGGGFVVDGVAAGPGIDATARLDINVPAAAAADTQTIEVTASGGGAEDVLPISIRVNADAAGDITVTTDTPNLTGASNDTFPFALTVRNDTAQDTTVSATASVTDQPDWDVTAEIAGEEQAASTVVEAGSSTTINVTATPPANAAAGQYAVHVVVRAGDREIPGDFGVEITGSYAMALGRPNDLPLSESGSAGSPTTIQFEVTNTGTAPLDDIAVSATRQPTDWTITFNPEGGTLEPIAPGQVAVIDVTITPSSEAVAGDYQLVFTAAGAEVSEEAAIRFTVETSPIWAIVALLVIAAILGGLFYVFRTYGRR